MSQSEAPIDVFISYKREERHIAEALAEALARRGYQLWWDAELLPGDRFADAIMAVIKRAKAVVVLWSRQAVASDFVRAEAREADKQNKLIPIRLDDCDLPLPFGERQTLDLRGWWPAADESALKPLLRSLEARIGKAPEAPQPKAATEANLHSGDHEAAFWRAVSERQPQSAKEYEIYLSRYPQGVFVDLARHRINDLQRSKPVATATKALITTKNVLIALGAVAAAIMAVVTLGDQARERLESSGWRAPSNGAGAPPAPSLVAPVAESPAFEEPARVTSDLNAPLPDMVRVPPGNESLAFTMGSETGTSFERPALEVTIAQPFHMSRTPITFEQYAAFAAAIGLEAPKPRGLDEATGPMPVVQVTWQNARDYADWLGELTGSSCRLPSEAEWEFACRAGTETRYWWGDDFDPTMANTREGGPGRPTPVGTFPPTPNDWGLYDMSGNVWEWIEDHWHPNYVDAPRDRSAWLDQDPPETRARVVRGGAWNYLPDAARCASRRGFNPLGPNVSIGFRVVCSSPS
jgi:formylglycine-generating enzyme required for sulfatase activity